MCDIVQYPICSLYHYHHLHSHVYTPPYASIMIKPEIDCGGRGFTALRCTCMYYIIEYVRRNMAEEVEATSEKLRLKIRTTRRSEDVEVAPDCTVKEVG